ncbi:uncharacterized protein LOC109861488, partial [Pseudomyrmex gracilis]|uniref:uncharacterized protein LOC109861488 n=1 Tax=Pseudomyrmex gracilis TaxID=219809 RepID=UPI000994F865
MVAGMQGRSECTIYANAQSLLAHKEEIHHLIMVTRNPAIVALTETRLTQEIDDAEISVPGYNLVRCNSDSRYTGGVVIYVRNDVRYETILTRKLEPNCWTIAIKVKEKWCKSTVMVVYHSPSASDTDFINFLIDVVEDLITKSECIVIGDFNIDFTINSYYKKRLKTTMNSMGMKQYVKEPTRIARDSRSIIDLIFANKEVEKNYKDRKYIARNYNDFDVDQFIEILQNELQQNNNMNVNDRAKNLVDSIVQTLDVVAPKRQVKIPKIWEEKRWFNTEIRKAAARRDEAYKKAIQDNTELNWLHYKEERNRVVSMIRKTKKKYYEETIDCNKGNPTAMWKTLKEIIRGEANSMKETEDINFECLSNTEERNTADKFNQFYIQSIDNIVKSITKIPDSPKEITIKDYETRITLHQFDAVSILEVEKIIRQLPRKKGTDDSISTDIMKTAWQVINSEFVDIINSSLSKGICPKVWKTSTIKPIPKIDQPKKASQFRPINMLPTFEKVLELVVKKQLDKYLENNNIITEHQSELRKGYSCKTAIQAVVDDWKITISENKMIGVVFMDLKRAFETIDRVRLLVKMYQYGIRDRALEWFRSYLSSRFQQVHFDNKWSGECRREFLQKFAIVKRKLNHIIYLLQSQDQKSQPAQENHENLLPDFPLTTVQDLNDFNERLQDDGAQRQL